MDLISRMLRTLLILTALLLTCISFSTGWLGERRSLAEWIDDCSALLEAQRKGEELENEAQSTVKRVEVKEKIAEALTKSEMTLIEAAATFRWLHEDPKSWRHPHRPRPESKDSEGWCREVIAWTWQYMRFNQSPSQTEALHQRLEAELQHQRKGHNSATLPE